MAAQIVLDSINPYTGVRITTLHLEYPQYIHGQFMSHRMFSRNSSSGRAMSVTRLTNADITLPIWTKEKKGMQGEVLDRLGEDKDITDRANEIVSEMYWFAKEKAGELEALGIHHQNINVYLKSFFNIHTLVTATEWQNFFNLRISDHAQPEIKQLAIAIKIAMEQSEPVERLEHVPYYENYYYFSSAGRCARISYLSDSVDSGTDAKLGDKLWENKHLTPFEHIAFARLDCWYANFNTWQSYRNCKGY